MNIKERFISFLDLYRTFIFWSYLALILLLVILPLNNQENLILNNTYLVEIRLDHLLHGILFIPWLFIGSRLRGMPLPLAIIGGLLLALSAEGLQYFLPYRAFNINDMISNAIGVFLGLPLVLPTMGGTGRRALSTKTF